MTTPAFDPEKHLEELLKMEEMEERAQNPEEIGESPGEKVTSSEIDFDIKPEELEEYLNQYVVKQEPTIEVIATKVCTHFNRMKIEHKISEEERIVGSIKSNMLLIGPTGVGKTYIVKLIAKRIGVPFVKADATKFSETGYVGGDVEDLIRELVHEADGDVAKAEYGIVYLDEIDKIATSRGVSGPDVSRSGVQRNLLKLMEEAEVDLKTPHDLASQVEAAMEAQKTGKVTRKKISTRNILFIVSGAFSGLDELISKRMNKQAIGFDKMKFVPGLANQVLKQVRTEDLLEFGFESEFVGRLPVTVVLNELDGDGLYQILKNRYSTVVLGKKMDFRAYGIDLQFTDDALRILAERAWNEKTGARGLLKVTERVLIKFEKKLPSTDIDTLVVDKELVEDPEKVLKRMLREEGIKTFQKDFLVEHGIYLDFTAATKDRLSKKAEDEGQDLHQLCHDLFHDYHHGLRLMKLDHFTVPVEAVDDSTGFLDRYIRENYQE